MHRRRFLSLTATAAVSTIVRRTSAQSARTIKIESPTTSGILMPLDFTGLSYESGQLYNPSFFSADNTALITAFRNLNPNGILRLGGHLSNIAPWEGIGQEDPKQIRGVHHGIEDYWEWPLVDPTIQRNKKGILTRKALTNLRAFLDVVNWRLLYTLNFACGSPARAADEADAVTQILGPRLIAFIIGNEPDGFGEDKFFRAKGYDFPQYITEWKSWAKTIRATVPTARFVGPDTEDEINTWVRDFARQTRGDTILITSHFYGMGPARDPSMTATHLLEKSSPRLAEFLAGAKAASAAAGGTAFRMDEGNSCFGGGRLGVSDAYASALWAADFMLQTACAGIVGVNFHGGGIGFYTPIETSDKSPATPRPVYYGMQFAQQFAGLKIAPCPINMSENLTAYYATANNQAKLAVINKSSDALNLELPSAFQTKLTQQWTLEAPSLEAKQKIQFREQKKSPDTATKKVAAYSAIILQMTS
ncbi:MAG TPA: hypothetical protein VNU92_14220 [Edaphobacter sp.]|nr:hypothetical protein [Edaphobacter sp.]